MLSTSGAELDRVGIDARAHFIDAQSGSIEMSSQLAQLEGSAVHKNLRYWLYFGQWKYFPTITGMKGPADVARWRLQVTEPGEYRVSLVYAADAHEAGQEGRLALAASGMEQSMLFRVLETDAISTGKPALTVTHELGIMDFPEGSTDLSIAPIQDGVNLFKIKKVVLDPVD